ncbi:MAG: porin [Alphaproteobacteria bacterium]
MRGLLFSTIIATGAIAGSALALDVETNGYARFALQGNNIDGNEGTGFAKDWEFEFKGKETLDNGMTVFVDLEVDANGGADEIRTDDVTFGVSGGFGTVTVGIFNLGKVKAGQGLVPTAAGSAYGFGGLEAGDNQRNWDNGKTSLHHYSDRPSIAYTAPKISGFTVGGIYSTSDGDGQSTGVTAENTRINTVSVGAQYGLSAGEAKVTIGAAYTNMEAQNPAANDDSSMMIGATVGMGAFTIKAAYKNGEHAADYDLAQVNAMYKTGPWTVSAAFAQGDNEGQDYQGYDLGASYSLGGGAKLMAGYTTDELGNNDSEALYGVGLQVGF